MKIINLEFEGARCNGRTVEVAKIGKSAVGEVELTPEGRFLALWVCYLDPKKTIHRAYSVAGAKAALAKHVTEWMDAAGLGQVRSAA